MQIEETNAKCPAQALKSSKCLIEASCLLLLLYSIIGYILLDMKVTYS